MSAICRRTPTLIRQQRAAPVQQPIKRSFSPCTCVRSPNRSASSQSSSSSNLSSSSHATDPFAFLSRHLSSSPKNREAAAPVSLLMDHELPGAAKENEAVTRIERLMRLGDKLAQTAAAPNVPLRLRGIGLYQHDHAAPTMPQDAEVEGLQPLPKTRRMGDSYVQMELRFSEDESLREQYVGGLSKVRTGRLMEGAFRFDSASQSAFLADSPVSVIDFDSLAVPPSISGTWPAKCAFAKRVTAAVDRMDVLRPLLNPDGSVPDLRLSGHVSYATESSLEVFVRLSTIPSSASEDPSTILLGRFAMACRSFSGGKHPIAKLVVEGPEEEEMWKMGKGMREGKKKRSMRSLEKNPPSAEEAALLHELFLQRAPLYGKLQCLLLSPKVSPIDSFHRNADRKIPTPPDVVFMNDTRINSAQLMHPQERNVHNKVFGGYLMRLAYETAYSTACLFSRSAVTFVALDELQFAQPVEIGSLLLLDSKVTFSPMKGEHKSFHVSVEVDETRMKKKAPDEGGSRRNSRDLRPLLGREEDHQVRFCTCSEYCVSCPDLTTVHLLFRSTFHFTFSSDKPLERHVIPRSYRQAMQWLDAQRRRAVGIEVRKVYNSS
ncbi:SPOSA6832_00658, partial [Sporobolomyces salmonicolor]